MFRRVLAVVDRTDDALRVARIAAELARAGKGRVRACYVVDEAPTPVTPVVLRDRLRDELAAEGRAVIRAVLDLCRDLRVPSSGTLAEGVPGLAILQAARGFRADLVVLATHGPGRIQAFIEGSLVLSVLQKAPCPVLVLRRGTHKPRGARARRRRRT